MASRNYKQTHEVQLLFDQEKLEPIKNEENNRMKIKAGSRKTEC